MRWDLGCKRICNKLWFWASSSDDDDGSSHTSVGNQNLCGPWTPLSEALHWDAQRETFLSFLFFFFFNFLFRDKESCQAAVTAAAAVAFLHLSGAR